MNWIVDLFTTHTVANSILLLALAIALGLLLSRLKFRNFSLGVTWILFAGIAMGQLGMSIEPCTAHFAKEFGLILFIYSIGIEVGPRFFSSFRSGGVLLNVLALGIVLLGCLLTLGIGAATGTAPAAMTGVLYGAVTNTPGLGAAQQTFLEAYGSSNPVFAQGYAVAYPMGVVGIILSIMILKKRYGGDARRELETMQRNASFNGMQYQEKLTEKQRQLENSLEGRKKKNQPNLFFIFFGIMLGVLLGSIPVSIPGMSVPVKLGLAGGPLIVAILVAYFGPRMHINTYTTESANLMIRQIGISLFMASVGLDAGQGFVQTILGGGYWWMLFGVVITMVPCLTIGWMARRFFHLSIYTIAGLISGSTTDPPALAYSNSLSGTNQASIAYTTVYPLTMFLRVIAAQMFVLLW